MPDRRTIPLIATTVAATLLVLLAAFASWRALANWRQGRVVLTNDGPPLTVQVLDASGEEPIGEPVELIRRASLALPPGDYRLRITGEGRLSRTYRLAVNRGESFTQALTLDDDRLLGERAIQGAGEPPRRDPIPFTPGTMAIELKPGKADLVERSQTKLCRRDGITGEVVWDALEPAKPGKPPRLYHPWLLWFVTNHPNGIKVIEPAPDVDGDGTRDLVWATGSAFLAVSGRDGSVLWTYLAELDGPGGAYPEGPELPGPIRPATREAQLLGQPSAADLDRDGVPDIVATIVFTEFPAETIRRRPEVAGDLVARVRARLNRRVIVAVSGRSGRCLWSHPIDPAFRQIPNRAWNHPAIVVPGRRSSTVGLIDGPKWTGLDSANGRPRIGPIDLGFEPVRPLQHADLDGDGEPEILAMGPGSTGKDQALTALSIATGRSLWTATINVKYQHPFDGITQPDWPTIVDLDGDGRAEIAVPDAGVLDSNNGYRGARLLDGATGRPRWTRPMRPETRGADGLFDFVEAPDLDRDGVRDLVTSSFFLGRAPINANQHGPGEEERVYIDALSGKDGRPLWWWHYDRPTDRTTHMAAPKWWGRGPDGWPLLAVPIEVQHPRMTFRTFPPSDTDPPTLHILEASTGREIQSTSWFTHTAVADLDGDGLLDLWGACREEYRWNLRAFRGEGPEVWRALGSFSPARAWSDPLRDEFRPPSDFDGDGLGDLLIAGVTAPGEMPSQVNGSRTALARSGRDGRLLWRADLGLRRGWFEPDRAENYSLASWPMPAGDLDGDGTPDVIVRENHREPPARVLRDPATLPLIVLSGRTGRPAWVAGPLPLEFEAHGYSEISWAIPQIIEPGRAPDLLVRHSSPFSKASPTPPPMNSPAQDRLARLSGRTGRILWDVPLEGGPRLSGGFSNIPPAIFEDFDGDGGLDALLLVRSTAGAPKPGLELKAVSLRDGRLLWSQGIDDSFPFQPRLTIFDDDGRRPAIATMSQLVESNRTVLRIRAFDGRDGTTRWNWNSGALFYDGRPPHPWMVSARLEQGKPRRICVTFQESGGKTRIVVLDDRGREQHRRDLGPEYDLSLRAADLDGDGRDELVFWHGGRLHAWAGDMAELWSCPDRSAWIVSFLPASTDRPALLTLRSGLAIDARTGLPRWLSQTEQGWPASPGQLFDPGDSARRPLLVYNPAAMTIVRSAMATTPTGVLAPPVGDPVPPGRADHDPRWTRPLPWTMPILHTIGPKGFLAFVGLALVNVAVPLGFLWLAARRRPWTLRLLMALPVAAAIPLSVFQTIEPLVPAQIGTRPASSELVFALATLAGLPIAAFAVLVARNLFRRRWRSLALLAGLTLLATMAVAGAWLWIDGRSMPAIEHYDGSTGYLAVVPGVFLVGGLILIGWASRGMFRAIMKPGKRRTPRPLDATLTAPNI